MCVIMPVLSSWNLRWVQVSVLQLLENPAGEKDNGSGSMIAFDTTYAS